MSNYSGSGTEGTVGTYTIEQFGVTWTFDKPLYAEDNPSIENPSNENPSQWGCYFYGQYANGD
jgi:hypothetical protein